MMSVVAVTDVQFSWRSRSHLLDIPTFQVAEKERVFLCGPSGSGKSTLLNLLTGMLLPQQGIISVNATDITLLSGAQRDQFRADYMGFIFQVFNLLPYLSLRDNVALACQFSTGRKARAISQHGSVDSAVEYLLERLGLAEPLVRNAKVAELSVGQQQRVAVARALVGAPALIIADEPTSALDKVAREQFIQVLNHLVADYQSALIMVSHDDSLAAPFDRTLQLTQLNRASSLSAAR